MILRAAILFAAIAIAADPALAHPLPGGIGGFYGGLLHPLIVPSHLLALVGLGLLIGQAHERTIPLAIFAAALATGLAALVNAVAADNIEYGILAVAAVLGVLVAIARPPPAIVVGALALIAGAAIELDSTPDEISMLTSFIALAATAIVCFFVVLLVAGIAATRKAQWQQIGARVLGSWIAAGSLLVLALRLAR